MTKILNLMSGGIDSTAAAKFFLNQGMEVKGLFVDYGQAASLQENNAVQNIADNLKLELTVARASFCTKLHAGEIVGRNAFLVSCGLMSLNNENFISIGIHNGTPYYDCGHGFFESMNRLVSEYTDGRVKLIAPFLDWSKSEIFAFFESHHLPIALSYSCEVGASEACGECLSCKDRAALSVSGT